MRQIDPQRGTIVSDHQIQLPMRMPSRLAVMTVTRIRFERALRDVVELLDQPEPDSSRALEVAQLALLVG